MRWADVDLSTGIWTKLAANVKQATDHVVPLSAPAQLLLSEIRARQGGQRKTLGTYVFPSSDSSVGHRVDIDRDWRQLYRTAGIEGLRVDDIRHSFASTVASFGGSLPLIGSLLGHASPSTTARYSHLFVDPQRAAVEKVGQIIAAAGADNPPTAVVETLRRPRGR
jgi:integrase